MSVRDYTTVKANSRTAAQAVGNTGSRVLARAPTRHAHQGNTATRRGEWPRLLQAKLTVSHSNDLYEQEAERVADQAMRMPAPALTGSGIDPTPIGRRLLAHELTHVVQQSGNPMRQGLQRFTAALGDAGKVSISPEKGDADADLDRVLCPAITDRKIRGRTSIDVSACFPAGIVKAMSLGPANCSDFVNKAMGTAGSGTDFDALMTPKLWEAMLKKGHRIRGFAVMKPDGKVEKAEGISWPQLNPKMGDLVFMHGSVRVKKGKTEPDPKGDDFVVTWDHVGFFIVRSRKGFDFHLAKDGDENPIDVYRTGMELTEGLAPGAYVTGTGSLMAYLGPPGTGGEEKTDRYVPGGASRAYAELSPEERAAVNEETDRRFKEETGVTRRLDWDDPKDRPMVRRWLRLRDQVMAKRKSGEEGVPLRRAIRNRELETRNPDGAPPIVHEVLRSPGRPLDAAARAFFEPRFGVDFSAVRIHADSQAAASARAVNALAYTVDRDVVFDTGQYAPHSESGRRLLAHELTHVVQQGNGAPERVFRQQSGVSVRSPTLEISALRSQQFLSFGGSPLLPAERSAAASVFGSSLDLGAVRIVHSPVVAAPTTLGNTIRVPPGYTMPQHVLIHELAHIWQYQTMGSRYISDSLWHQTAATVSSLVATGTADRSGAYRYAIVPGQSFYVYTAEQQASIVEDYFVAPMLQADPEYRRLIAQVRAARPLNVSQAFWEEQAAGLPPRQWAVPNPRESGFGAEGGSVPQLEFRFPGL